VAVERDGFVCQTYGVDAVGGEWLKEGDGIPGVADLAIYAGYHEVLRGLCIGERMPRVTFGVDPVTRLRRTVGDLNPGAEG
jgi:hypothetical protein